MESKKFSLMNAKGVGISYSVMIAVYVLISIIGSMILGAIGVEEYSVSYYAITACIPIFTIILVLSVFCKIESVGIKHVFGMNQCSPAYFAIALLVAVGMFLGFGALNEKFAEMIKTLGGTVPTHGVSDVITDAKTFVLFSFLIGLFPAIAEEMFFRGLMVGGLKKTGTLFAVFAVAICFSLYHASIVQFIYQLIYGGVLTLLTIKAKSVFPAMTAHFTNNFGILVLGFFFNIENVFKNAALIIVGIVLVTLSVVFLVFGNRSETHTRIPGERKDFLLFSSIGVVVCLIIIVMGVIGF